MGVDLGNLSLGNVSNQSYHLKYLYSGRNVTSFRDLYLNSNDGNTSTGLDGMVDTGSTGMILYLSRLLIHKVCMPPLLVISLLGNLCSMFVFFHRDMACTTCYLLAALGFFDMFHVAFSFSLSFVHYPWIYNTWVYRRYLPWAYPLTDMCSNASVWLVVLFTSEYYFKVRFLPQARRICNIRNVKISIGLISAFALLSTIPTCFERRLEYPTAGLGTTMVSVRNVRIPESEILYANVMGDALPHTSIILPRTDNEATFTPTLFNFPALVVNQNSFNMVKTDGYRGHKRRHYVKFTTKAMTFILRYATANVTLNSSAVKKGECQGPDCYRRLWRKRHVMLHGEITSPEPDIIVRPDLPQIMATPLALNPTYQRIYFWYTGITFSLLPLTLLVIFTYLLTSAFKKHGSRLSYVIINKFGQACVVSASHHLEPIEELKEFNIRHNRRMSAGPSSTTSSSPERKQKNAFKVMVKRRIPFGTNPSGSKEGDDKAVSKYSWARRHKSLDPHARKVSSDVMLNGTKYHDKTEYTHHKLSEYKNADQSLSLILVVVVFFVCQTPSTILMLLTIFLSDSSQDKYATGLTTLNNVSNLLMAINGSINFFLYYKFDIKFHRTLQKCFRTKSST